MLLVLKIRSFLKRPVIQNFSVLTFSNILVQGFNVFTSIKIAKNLMPEGYGFYSFIMSLSAIYVVFVQLGMRNVIVRGIAVNKDDSGNQFTTSFIARAAAFVLVALAVIIYNTWFSKITLNASYMFWLCLLILSTAHWDTVESVTFGHEKMKYSAYINLALTIGWFIVIMILPVEYIKPYMVLVLTVVFQVVKSIVLTICAYANKMFAVTAFPPWGEIVSKLKESFPFYVLAIFTLFTSSLPIIYLEHLSTEKEIAFFNIAGRLISPLQLLLFTLLSSLYPALSRNFEYDKEKFLRTIKIAFLVIFGAGVVGAFTVSTFRNEIVYLLYGEKYAESANVISIQCWFTTLFGVFCLIGTILSAVHKQYLLSKLSIAYALISFPCLLYGAKYGAVGLSVGFVVAAIINMTYHIYYLQKSLPQRISNIYLYISILVYIFLFIGSLFITKLNFGVRVIILLSVFAVIGYRSFKFWEQQQKKGENVFAK